MPGEIQGSQNKINMYFRRADLLVELKIPSLPFFSSLNFITYSDSITSSINLSVDGNWVLETES
jgi:hypothetical protein